MAPHVLQPGLPLTSLQDVSQAFSKCQVCLSLRTARQSAVGLRLCSGVVPLHICRFYNSFLCGLEHSTFAIYACSALMPQDMQIGTKTV